MAFPGSNFPTEVGLRLLLNPLGSNIVVRTACCSVGVVLPVYSTFKAIERKDPDEQQRCLVYWAAYGSFTIAEMITDKLVYWFPLYYHMKFAFLVWLQLPSANGASQLYMNYLRPFLLRHQEKLDEIVGFLYGEMAKFVSSHQGELQFIKKIIVSTAGAATQVLREIVQPLRRDVGRAIAGPTTEQEVRRDVGHAIEGPTTEQEEDSNSGHED